MKKTFQRHILLSFSHYLTTFKNNAFRMAKYLNLWPLTTSDQVGSLASAHEMVCGYQA